MVAHFALKISNSKLVHHVGFPFLNYSEQKKFLTIWKRFEKKGIDHEVEEVLEIDIQKEKKKRS